MINKENSELENIDYSFSFLFSVKWIAGISIFFIIMLLSFVPFQKTIDSIIYSSLNLGPNCQLKIKDYNFKLFMPKIVIENIHAPGGCFQGQNPEGLNLNHATLSFRGLSFSPLGISTKLSTEIFGSKIEAFIIPGVSAISIYLESESENGKFITDINKINLNKLGHIFPMLKLSGDIYLSKLLIEMSYTNEIEDLVVNIASNNLILPTQSIGLPPNGQLKFALTSLNINSLLVQIIMLDGQKIALKKFILGDERSPIKAKFNGDINLNIKNLLSSQINLKGELGFTTEFLNKYGILKLALASFDNKDNFYQIQLKGPLGSPKPSSAR